jgi:hypothetical protein
MVSCQRPRLERIASRPAKAPIRRESDALQRTLMPRSGRATLKIQPSLVFGDHHAECSPRTD